MRLDILRTIGVTISMRFQRNTVSQCQDRHSARTDTAFALHPSLTYCCLRFCCSNGLRGFQVLGATSLKHG